ncbi:hypothetical protein [Malaciobacter mytili]|uniref:DUF3649 domain-containing protein n=1 Tax=Malaciobacter mytili LMG 24559 TaxID=1032238 RepID=A0AAX2AGB3_9BACT|nr:hypothetical protein [Malaciobacter mytili]AXH14031.1 putative membrane protein [Malaciobacter mytili LMG 24559]RXI43371.1 hypothetical protein CRU99_07815 [Malaciobacter mytili]RXK15063.1 hypothetical protein CP985_10400 [Malaciobacter mytili LMG 24559]
MIKKIYQILKTPETNGKQIGIFRIFSSIFGGLLVAYLGMTLVAFLIPLEVKESAIISIMFNTFAYAGAITWIALASSKLEALKRVLIPTTIFTIALYFFIKEF